MVATAWFAMYGPAGLSADTVARLEKAVTAAVRKPAVQRADLARWEKPIKATGVQLD